VLQPNKEIKEGYMAFEVTTKDGDEYQGYKLRRGTQRIVLRDLLQNKEISIRLDDIQSRKRSAR